MTALTLEQQVIGNIAAAEIRSHTTENNEPEIRIYETKTYRKLATGEIKEYILKHHYVVKKRPGICKTELKKRESKLRSEIVGMLHNLEIPQLIEFKELCQQLNDRPYVPGNPLDVLRVIPENLQASELLEVSSTPCCPFVTAR